MSMLERRAVRVRGTNLSPYTLCLFLLGLAPKLRSLDWPTSAKFRRALLKALGSIGSEPALGRPFACDPFMICLAAVIGGVFDEGGDGGG